MAVRERHLLAAAIGVTVLACAAGARALVKRPTPARDLTEDDARLELDRLHRAGLVDVVEGTSKRIIIASTIDRVRFLYSTQDAGSATIDNLDVRYAVLLARFATFVRRRYNASIVRHLGISAGTGAANDCHNEGRAMDFAGLEGKNWRAMVLDDWGKVPAPYPADTEETRFRLDARRYPGEMFARVYDFFAHEATDTVPHRGGNPKEATTVGPESRYIVHPDHHSPTLRARHQDHVHSQIGPTLGPDPDIS